MKVKTLQLQLPVPTGRVVIHPWPPSCCPFGCCLCAALSQSRSAYVNVQLLSDASPGNAAVSSVSWLSRRPITYHHFLVFLKTYTILKAKQISTIFYLWGLILFYKSILPCTFIALGHCLKYVILSTLNYSCLYFIMLTTTSYCYSTCRTFSTCSLGHLWRFVFIVQYPFYHTLYSSHLQGKAYEDGPK